MHMLFSRDPDLRFNEMAYKHSPAKQPSALLRETKGLKSLLRQADRIEHLQRLLESQIQPAARPHCKVASWREGTLLLIVTDGGWATRLRYQQKRLHRDLQQLSEFSNLMRILFKVEPSYTKEPPKRTIELSKRAAASLHEAAEGITNPGLKAALERLASHAFDKEKEKPEG